MHHFPIEGLTVVIKIGAVQAIFSPDFASGSSIGKNNNIALAIAIKVPAVFNEAIRQ